MPEKKMLLSIIVPIYRVEKYIRECLVSLYPPGLNYDDYEVVIVNDGTPDRSMEIVGEYSKAYPNIRVIEQNNQGLSSARNAGFSVAQGSYYWFIDSDDWISEGAIEAILNACRPMNCDVFTIPVREINDKTGDYIDHMPIAEGGPTREWIARSLDLHRFNTMAQSYVIRRLDNERDPFVPGLIHEDVMYTLPRLLRTSTLRPIFEAVYMYRIRPGSITTGTNTDRRKVSLIKIAKEYDMMAKYELDSDASRILKAMNRNTIYMLLILGRNTIHDVITMAGLFSRSNPSIKNWLSFAKLYIYSGVRAISARQSELAR